MSPAPFRHLHWILAALAFVWACSRPVPPHSVDAQTSPARQTPGARAPGRPVRLDPCAQAISRGEATAIDSQGRPRAPRGPAPPDQGAGAEFPRGPTPRSDGAAHGDGNADGGASGGDAEGIVPPPRIWLSTPRRDPAATPHRIELQVLHHEDGGCLEVFVEGRLRGRLSTRSDARVAGRPTTGPSRARGIRQLLRWSLPTPEPSTQGGSRGIAANDGGAQGSSDPEADGQQPRPAPGRASPPPVRDYVVYEVALEAQERLLELRAVGRGTVRLFGLSTHLGRPGVVLHNVAVVGAQAANTLAGQAALVDRQIRRLDPTLVAVMLGTNDAYDDRTTADQHEKRLTSLLRRLRGGGTPADCLVLSAPDFGDAHFRKARALRRQAAVVRTVQRRVATAQGCAFWDVYAAMGGTDSITRMQRSHPPFAYRDRVHLTAQGYGALGLLLHEALMQRYAAYLAARPRLRLSPPDPTAGPEEQKQEREARRRWPTGLGAVALDDGGGRALSRWFRSLVLLARKASRAEARMLFVGDSHVAGDLLTGELRRRLQRDFGDAGHGYLQAGTPWTGYSRQGLRLGATGPWQYYYLRTRHQAEQPGDTLFGLGGVSTWITLR